MGSHDRESLTDVPAKLSGAMSREEFRNYSERRFPVEGFSENLRTEGSYGGRGGADWRSSSANPRESYGGGGGRPPRRPSKASIRKTLFAITVLGLIAFGGGFMAMWSLGSVIVGGSVFGGSNGAELSVEAMPVDTDYKVEPLVDLLAFRDLAYVPVKAVAVLPSRSAGYMDRVIAAIDRTEINSLVVTVKDDLGRIAFDTDMALGVKYGSISTAPGVGIADLDTLIDKLVEHNIVPIARIVTFKDDLVARRRLEMAVMTSSGELFIDGEGNAWLNPYNHDVWEYMVQIAEECARRGFREIQFDYVRFPSAGTANAVYPGRYCAKEDAIAGFLEYARPRLEALGVWVSADVFGWVVGNTGDMGIGQQLEKLCQNIDVLCPMVYPSLYGEWSYSVDKPEERPYDIVHAALTDAEERLVGTGAKGRPYLLAADGKLVESTAEWVKAQIQAAEDLGFNEWMLWGGYIEDALRTADGTYNGPALNEYAPIASTGVATTATSTTTTLGE